MARTLGPEVGRWFAANLRLPDGSPFQPAEFQRYILDLIYEVDAAGAWQWRFVVIGMPRGNGKSPLCGAIADFELCARAHGPLIICAAGAREQAGIVHNNAFALAKGGPLEDFIEFPRVKTALGPLKCPHNDGILRVVSADGDLQQGHIPDVVIEDEPHTFRTEKQVGLHFALTTALHKRPDSRMILISTAGASKQSMFGDLCDAILKRSDIERSDDGCLTVGRDYEGKSLILWWGAPDSAAASDPAIWRACNPAPWITDESLFLAARREQGAIFRRYYLNQWVLGEDAAIQPDAWDACRRHLSPIPAGRDVWVGIDIGEKRDHSAVAIVHPRPSGRLHVEARDFSPEAENVVSLLPMVEAEIRRIAADYQVRAVAYDAWQMRDLANRLSSEGLRMIEWPQKDGKMVPASQGLVDRINARQIMHNGDPVLRERALNAAALITARGGWRFAKPAGKGGRADGRRKVDALIALTMAVAAWNDDNAVEGEVWATSW